MTLPFSLGTLPLPAWLPWWIPAALAVPLGLYLLLALLVPFGTFGVKSRLEDLEVQLDELRGDVRELMHRVAPADQAEARSAADGRGRGVGDARGVGLRAEPRLDPR